MLRRIIVFSALSLLVARQGIGGQTGSIDATQARTDSIFSRARQLVTAGNGAAGRQLVDSVLATIDPETPSYAEALYWRASLASTSGDAERDYRRIVVDYPLAPRTADALLQLAQIEVLRGDRSAAATHLQRFLLENPHHSERPRAGYLLVRAFFEQNELTRGCGALARARAELSRDAVEQRNQLEYFAPRCAGVDTTTRSSEVDDAQRGAAKDSVRDARPDQANARRDVAHRDSAGSDDPTEKTPAKPQPAEKAPAKAQSSPGAAATGKEPARTGPAREPAKSESAKSESAKPGSTKSESAKGRYTLQIAAYSDRADAERLAKKLDGRGFSARVVGSARPYRVRIGRYVTRNEAASAAKQLKAKGIDVFITEIGTDDR